MKRVLLCLSLASFAFLSDCTAQWVQVNGPYRYVPKIGVSAIGVYGHAVLVQLSIDSTFVTSDGGVTFDPFELPFREGVMKFFSAQKHLLAVPWSDGKLYEYSDGTGWSEADTNLFNHNVLSFSSLGSTLFIGTRDSGVYRSTDHGVTWKPSNSGLPKVVSVPMLQTIGTVLLADATRGLFRSTDNGLSWRPVSNNPPSDPEVTGVLDTTVFAQASDGLFRSSDRGVTWSRDLVGPGGIVSGFASLGSQIFAATSAGVYESGEGVAGWTAANNGLPLNAQVDGIVTDGSNLFVLLREGSLYVSNNNGAVWSQIQKSTYVPTRMAADAMLSVGADLYVSNYGSGVYRSDNNGDTWEHLSGAFDTMQVRSFAAIGPDVYLASNGYGNVPGGVFRTTDRGEHWTQVYSSRYGAIAATSDSLYAAVDSTVMLSTNSGSTWITTNIGLPAERGLGIWAHGKILMIYLQGGGDFRSTDGGKSWSEGSNGLPHPATSFAWLGSTILAADGTEGVYSSDNDGAIWLPTNTIPGVRTISEVFATQGIAFADGGPIVFSRNRGATWMNAGFENSQTTDNILAGNDRYLFSSRQIGGDSGGIWRRALTDLLPASAGRTSHDPGAIEVYLDPVSWHAAITLTLPDETVAKVRILNVLGEEVTRLFDGLLHEGSQTLSWNTANATSGLYWCETTSKHSRLSKAIVIAR